MGEKAKRSARRPGSGASRRRAAPLALAACALALAAGASPAAAGLYHPEPRAASFGPDGGACPEGNLATGTGDIEAGSTEVTNFNPECGSFEAGRRISVVGHEAFQSSAFATIEAVGAGTLTLSRPTLESRAGAALAVDSTFEEAGPLGLDQAARRLFAANRRTERLFGFDLATPFGPLGGAFPLSIHTSFRLANATSIAVDNSGGPTQGNLYTATTPGPPSGDRLLYGYDPAGDPLPGFPIEAPPNPKTDKDSFDALAVDPDGNVWGAAGYEWNGLLVKYSPAGTLVGEVTIPGALGTEGFVNSLAFDAGGDLYASVPKQGDVFKLPAPAYEELVPLGLGRSGTIAVDRSNGDLYSAPPVGARVSRYRSDGALLEELDTAGLDPSGGAGIAGIALEEASKAVYLLADEGNSSKVSAFEALRLPDLSLAPPSSPAESSVTLNGTVHPDGLALTECRFEYLTEAAWEASGFEDLSTGGEAPCEPASGSIPAAGTTAVSAALSGLEDGVPYRYRVVAANANGANTTKGAPGALTLAKPAVETVGSPVRTASTARLDARLDPHGIATAYRFRYLSDAAYQANLAAGREAFAGAAETPSREAGSGAEAKLVSETVGGLAPATSYRYRLLADNGAFGGPAEGAARSVTTRASDAPLSHGAFPGPPGSDRAWEQVSLPDSSGNPVKGAAGVAADGESALYQVTGGTPVSETGTAYNYLFARRPAGAHPGEGWRTEPVFPGREEATFSAWRPLTGDDSLSTLLGVNLDFTSGSGAGVWRMPTGGGAPEKLYEAGQETYRDPYLFSADGSRALLVLEGAGLDPAHNSPFGVPQLYDVSSGAPRMASLPPGGGDPGCPVELGSGGVNWVAAGTGWVSAEGARAYFYAATNESCSDPHLYLRDFGAEETRRVDGPALEGPECEGRLLRATSEAAYLWTQAKLSEADTAIAGDCAGDQGEAPGADVYRYELASGAYECLTCVAPGGRPADAIANRAFIVSPPRSVAVSPDGSRVYFTTESHLLAGAPEAGETAVYRVNAETGELAYVAPLRLGETVGESPQGAFQSVAAISADGRYLAFRSAAPALDELSGSENGGKAQYYLYDDARRSLSCASCPADGSPPRAAAAASGVAIETEPGPNMSFLAEDGTLAFATPTALVSADQNTAAAGEDPAAGTDVYEWRDGRALLVSDGLASWPSEFVAPQVSAISRSGRDLFFTEAARLTPDALDGAARLYDARIGGGIEFPPEAPPCPLEACQGIPEGAPAATAPGSAAFAGPGNLAEGGGCAPAARAARRLSRQARRLRARARRLARSARRGPAPRRARGMRRRANGLGVRARRRAKAAKRRSRAAKRCRRASR